MIEENPELAVDRVRQSLAVNPNSAYAWAILAGVERNAGRFTEALEASEQAMRLSPRDSGMSMFLFQHSASLFYLTRYEECVEWAHRATESPAPVPRAFVFLAAALVRLDRPKDAARILADLKRYFPNYSLPESSGGLAIQALSAAGLSR